MSESRAPALLPLQGGGSERSKREGVKERTGKAVKAFGSSTLFDAADPLLTSPFQGEGLPAAAQRAQANAEQSA